MKKSEKTPWNPSRKAIARVKNPLPAPTACPYCGRAVTIQNHDEFYGRAYGEWPWLYACENKKCRASVGMHPFTAIPLGTLADKATRDARKMAKIFFEPLWKNGEMTRSEAYAWLAGKMGIPNVEECHIGWFNIEQCNRVVEKCRNFDKENF